ncbi:tryptophan 2-C-methyltransferase [Sciscionella sediminilitoris]|uniref:tryptophan 2-C-methyltransferase n=1 Tax=Sciscionella sediminilitoris TaxID=1445613 RepID=UPI0004DEE48E|nr:tryptophan 2-C-methyltransferase [Sciscionella sp. SE31]
MTKGLVTLVNPNQVHPPITPYALDILTTALELGGFRAEVLDLCWHRDDWRSVLLEYFATHRPLLVGVTVRNTDTIYPQEQRVFLEQHRAVFRQIAGQCAAPIVAGGVGFSSMPYALVEYFDIPYGVKGPGEHHILELACALAEDRAPHRAPGLIVNAGHPLVYPEQGGTAAPARNPALAGTAYLRRSGVPGKVDNLAYYRHGGLGNILTKNGCPFACTHCMEPDAKGSRFTRRPVTAVVDEMELLTASGVYDLHTTDSEFNLLISHTKAVLAEVIRRKRTDPGSPLHRMRLWIYAQPAPFDAELMELLAGAGCAGINLAPDHVRDELLDGWKVTARGTRFYTADDIGTVCALARAHGIPVMAEVLLAMPGETAATLADIVRRSLDWDAAVVGYTLGIRVFPYSPLGIRFAAECAGRDTVPGLQSNTAVEPIVLTPRAECTDAAAYERQFLFDGHGRIRPVYYFSPELPEDPGTLRAPDGRWTRTLRLLRSLVPETEQHRVMLPTEPGSGAEDNNYADNPFLLQLTRLRYTGAYWSYWPQRERIMREARAGEQYQAVLPGKVADDARANL